mgnify:CR=1 FL=1
MSLEIAWKQNILVTDFHLLKSLLVVLGFGSQAFVDLADKTLTVCSIPYTGAKGQLGHTYTF